MAWHKVSLPVGIDVFAGSVVSDGRGGIWVEGSHGSTDWMLDYVGGRWHRYLAPGGKNESIDPLMLAAVPGTRSAWGGSAISPVSAHFTFFQSVIAQSVIGKYEP